MILVGKILDPRNKFWTQIKKELTKAKYFGPTQKIWPTEKINTGKIFDTGKKVYPRK